MDIKDLGDFYWSGQYSVNSKGNHHISHKGHYIEFDDAMDVVGGSPKAMKDSPWYDQEWLDKAALYAQYNIAQKSLNEDKLKHGVSCYVRFGSLPLCGYSTNYRENIPEKGVSVYAAKKIKDKVIIDARNTASPMFFEDRDLFFVSGELIEDKGTDGEPLLRNAKLGKKVKKYEICL